MAPTITRLVLSLALIVAAPVIYTIGFIIWYETMGYGNVATGLLLADVGVGLAFAIGWMAIWMGEVRWNPQRITLTALVFACSCLFAGVIGLVIYGAMNESELGILIGGMLWVVFWLFGTGFAWMERPAERRRRLANVGAADVVCPTCGYSLKGLKATACPECGSSFTIDQLFASHIEQRKTLGET